MEIDSPMVEYRQALPDEEDALLDLWTDANPGTDREAWGRTFAWMPNRFAQTWVAAEPSGTLRAAAVYSVRQVRDEAGVPQRVGHLSHVATAQAHRRRGHARRVVELALAAMRADGCAWSSLLTSEDARPLYEQLGWHPYARVSRRGVASGRPEDPATYRVRRFDPGAAPGGWHAIRLLYDAYNAVRPLTVVRDDDWWRVQPGRAAADTYAGHAPLVLTAHRDGRPEPCAYLWAYVLDDAAVAQQFGVEALFTVVEVAALPTESAALPALVGALSVELGGRRAAGQVFGPREPALDAAVAALFGETSNDVADAGFMARTVAPAFDEQRLRAMLESPDGVIWPLDDL